MIKNLIYIFLTSCALSVHAQDIMTEVFNSLQPVDTIPRNLLKTKSIVFLDIEPSNKEWDKITGIVHDYLKKPGIDAVAYYNLQDIYAGLDVSRSFTLDFKKRDISNVILIKTEGATNKIAVTFADFNRYLDLKNQPAWILEGTLKEITNALYVKAANSGIVKENLLINDIPELGLLTDPVGGNRAAFFSIELNESKIAIPYTVASDTLQMKELLDKYYPYDYGFVQEDVPEPELARIGYKYVLRYVRTSGQKIKKFYKYPDSDKVTDYPTIRRRDGKEEVKPIPKNQLVYKYYLKHLRSGRMFLGTEWDVDLVWSDALINHINRFKNEVGIR